MEQIKWFERNLNMRTSETNHDAAPIKELLNNFEIRKQTVDRLEKLNEEQVFRSALQPRLKTPMRTMDLFFCSRT